MRLNEKYQAQATMIHLQHHRPRFVEYILCLDTVKHTLPDPTNVRVKVVVGRRRHGNMQR